MDFRKVIYENVRKKQFISQHTYLCVRVTDILKFYVLFCTYCKGFFFISKKQSLCLCSSLRICIIHSQN